MFRQLSGDVDSLTYGAKWYRKVGETRYHVLELTNMWEATGEHEGERYCVELSEVDTTSEQLREALRFIGEESADCHPLAKVEGLHSYGARAPLGQWNGPNARKLLAEGRSESRSLDDPEAYERAMSKPVNALGSTAREYQRGDIDAAVRRGLRVGKPEARIVAKMSGIRGCKFSILLPSHYRPDGSCKCNDPEERAMMIREWGYTEESFNGEDAT